MFSLISVVFLFGPFHCQEGSQRARLCIHPGRWQAKNTPLHAPWNTLPLFTSLLTHPDLFTRPSQPNQKTHLAENNICVIIRLGHAWRRSSKQKQPKNTCAWLENGFIWPGRVCCARRLPAASTWRSHSPSVRSLLFHSFPLWDASMLWHRYSQILD